MAQIMLDAALVAGAALTPRCRQIRNLERFPFQ
jgi:hypothetical protein